MKAYLTTLAWMAFWVVVPTSCINIPPPGPMGDGAIKQIGLINWLQDNRQSGQPKPSQPISVKVTDKAVEITVPKK